VLKSKLEEERLPAFISCMDTPGESDRMIRSMTGYGQSSAELTGVRLVIELRSVNNRYVDLRFRIPSDLAFLEGELRRRVMGRIRRGRVEVAVRAEKLEGPAGGATFNTPLFDEVMAAAGKVKGEHGLAGELDLASLLSMPGMFRQETPEIVWGDEERKLLLGCLDDALDALEADRLREGAGLRNELLERLGSMTARTADVRRRAEELPRLVSDKLRLRIEALTEDLDLDPARIAQEVAHLADKCDITEEIVRLEGHLEQATAILAAGKDKPAGKRLDFLVQEIIRETNTICSKSSDLELTRSTLDLRAEVDKIREQVQNLE
jgi:uncharacterized protein (TIGR00255 family)